MNTYKSLVSFLFLIAAVKRGNAAFTPLTEKSICVKATLRQYTDSFACVCDAIEDVHITELECGPKITGECTKDKDICGDYAKCKVSSGPLKEDVFTCDCITGYEKNTASPAVCVPIGCKTIADSCGPNGFCSKKNDTSAQCSCHIGSEFDGTSSKCVVTPPDVPCKLVCPGENTGCVKSDDTHYKCGCAKGFHLHEGKCVKDEEEPKYTPLDANAKCVDGKLVQFANYYACLCNDGKIHSNDTTCVVASAEGKCTKENEVCGSYATCIKDTGKDTLSCVCNKGYELSNDQVPVCKAIGCKALKDTCENYECIKLDNDKAQCGCPLGKQIDPATGKCVASTIITQCNLTCSGENFECKKTDKNFFDCLCKDGYELKEGKCVKSAPVIEYVPLDASDTCTDGKLVQFANYFACACNDSKVHSDDTTCVTSTKGKCKKVNDTCGEYATCVKEDDNDHLTCLCNEGYELSGDKVPVCVPIGCKELKSTCESNKCIKETNDTAICGCPLNKKLDTSTGKCIASSSNPKCALTCTGENVECKIENNLFYDCQCKDNYELKEGKCVEKGDNGSAFPASGILNVGLLFLVSSIIYVLV